MKNNNMIENNLINNKILPKSNLNTLTDEISGIF